MKSLAIALLLALSPLYADEAPQALTPAAQAVAASPVAVSTLADAWGHGGVCYQFSFSQWVVFNGQPLAYAPFELGYDFGNGLRVMTGLDIFYYEAMDQENDEKRRDLGFRKYFHEMQDWRTSLVYRAPIDFRLRPSFGLSLNMVGGSMRLSPDFQGGKDINANSPKVSAWSYTGIGVQAGVEFLMTRDWSLVLNERYDFTLGSFPMVTATQLGVMVTF